MAGWFISVVRVYNRCGWWVISHFKHSNHWSHTSVANTLRPKKNGGNSDNSDTGLTNHELRRTRATKWLKQTPFLYPVIEKATFTNSKNIVFVPCNTKSHIRWLWLFVIAINTHAQFGTLYCLFTKSWEISQRTCIRTFSNSKSIFLYILPCFT